MSLKFNAACYKFLWCMLVYECEVSDVVCVVLYVVLLQFGRCFHFVCVRDCVCCVGLLVDWLVGLWV